MAETALRPVSGFLHGLPIPNAGDGVIVRDRDGLGVASIHARRGKAEAVAARLTEAFGVTPPPGPRRARGKTLALAGVGVGAWLATRENGANRLATELRAALGDLASVTDQSDGLPVLALTGTRLYDCLAKGVMLDLHRDVFKVDDCAVTSIAHIGATLWRLEDGPQGPRFEVAVFRSLAASFQHWLAESAAEFGLRMEP